MSSKVLRGLSKCFIMFVYMISNNAGNFLVKKLLFQPPEDYIDDNTIIKSGDNCWIHIKSRVQTDNIIIFLHGNASDISMNKDMGMLLANVGDVYMPEYTGYGSMRKHFPRRGSDGIMDNLRSFFDDVIRQRKNVCIVGQSLGSYYATRLAAEGYCSNLCLISAFYSIEKIANTDYAELLSYNTGEYIKNVTVNTLLLHGDKDTLVPYQHSQDLYDKCKSSKKRLKILEGCGHSFINFPIILDEITLLLK